MSRPQRIIKGASKTESENILFQDKNASKLSPSEISDIRVVQLPKKTMFWEKNLDLDKKNSSILSFYQFKELETIQWSQNYEQVGQVVLSMADFTRSALGFIFMIESNVKSPQYLSQRIELFLNNFQEKINSLTEAELEQYIQSMISNLRENPKSIFVEANDNSQLTSQQKFDGKVQLFAEIKNITLQDIQKIFYEIFFEENKKLEIHFVSNTHLVENNQIKEERFKNSEIEQVLSVIGSNFLFPDFYSKL